MFYVLKKPAFTSLLGLLLLTTACDIFNPPDCKTVGGNLYCTSNNAQVTQVGNQVTFKPTAATQPYSFELIKGTNVQVPHFETNRFTIKNDSTYSQTDFYGTMSGIKKFSMTTAWASVNGRVQLNVAYSKDSKIIGTNIKYYKRTLFPDGRNQYTLIDQKTFNGSTNRLFSNCLIGLPVNKTSAESEIDELSLKSIGQNSYDKPIVIPPGAKMQNNQTCNLMVLMPVREGATISFKDLKALKSTITLTEFKFFTLESSEFLPETL